MERPERVSNPVAIRGRGLAVVEVSRTDRRDRRLRGKSDTLDAENAARAVLAGRATSVPKGRSWGATPHGGPGQADFVQARRRFRPEYTSR